MQKRLLHLVACFVFPIAIGSTISLAQQYPFVHYTPKDGLVNSRVRKAYQDSKGIMYFMTFGGLSVYDGARFTNYTTQNGLTADMVNDIIEMGDDSLWIACNAPGLNYLRHGKVKTFKTADGFYPTINKFIKCNNGSIYVVADEGLFRFQQNRFVRMTFTNHHGLDAGKFLVEAVEWNDLLIVLADNGLSSLGPGNLYVFNKTTGKLRTESEHGNMLSICITGKNEIYITDEHGKVQMLDTTALLKQQVEFIPAPDPYKNIEGIKLMYFDNKKNFWFLWQHKKIIKIDSTGARKEFSMENGLGSNDFSDILMDKEGSFWITMNSSGVDKLADDNIEMYDKFMNSPVAAVYTDEHTDSVFIYSSSLKKLFMVHKGKITEQHFSGGPINLLTLVLSSGRIFIHDGKNISTIVKREGTDNSALYKSGPQGIFGSMFPDPYKNVVLSDGAHLAVLANDSLIFRYPIKYSVDQVAFDKANRLWAASRGGELFVMKLNPADHSNYLQLIKSFDKLPPGFSPRSLTADHLNNVWVGTRYEGLYWFRFDDQLNIISTQHYTIKDGLSDNFITQLTCDKENNIWASTASGIDKIVYTADKISIENITRGSNIYEYIMRTSVDKDGVAWSFTADGNLIRIGKTNYSTSFTPSLFITGLKIGNTAGDSLAVAASFSYKQNNLSISVAAPSFYDERQIKYSYLLQGSGNDQWSDPSNTSTFNFINLNPGKYTLKIKAAFPGNRYPDQVMDWAFVIHPPWWQTVLFRLIAASLIMGLMIIAVRFYYRRKLEKQKILSDKQQAVEKERTRIATDIHDDLGSGLSRIRYLGEMVKLKSSQQQNILPDIEKISVFSDEMVDKMNEIVWALNEKNDSLEAIISYTRSFAVEYLSNNNIECKVALPDIIPYHLIKGETRRNIFLSIKECLHNIVKHADATEVNIDISINSQLCICVYDNGKGIDWENMRPFSNGIMNIKKRMKDAGGTVEFKNENGTTVILKVPLSPLSTPWRGVGGEVV